MALDFKQFAAEGEQFVKKLAMDLGFPDDRDRAARTLRAVLHALRDVITIEEGVEFMAQLPMFLKAVYTEGWSLKGQLYKIHTMEQFVEAVRRHDGNVATRDFSSDDEIEKAAVLVFMALHKYVSLGELEDIRAVLPKSLKPLFNQVLMM